MRIAKNRLVSLHHKARTGKCGASKTDKELLHKILTSVMDGTYDTNEELQLEIYNAIK